MKALLLFLLFAAVQVVGSSVALLASHADRLAQGGQPDPLTPDPVVLGTVMCVAEALLCVALWWWYRHQSPWQRTFRPLRRPCAAMVLAAGGVCGVSLLLSWMLDPLGLSDGGTTSLFTAQLHNPGGLLLLCVVGPLCEELVFRAGILRSLVVSHRLPDWGAVAVTSLSFALVHGNLAQGIPALVLGLVLSYLYLRTGNLRLCLPAHVANNVLGVLLLAF